MCVEGEKGGKRKACIEGKMGGDGRIGCWNGTGVGDGRGNVGGRVEVKGLVGVVLGVMMLVVRVLG